jgi:hypothetical protein
LSLLPLLDVAASPVFLGLRLFAFGAALGISLRRESATQRCCFGAASRQWSATFDR